VLSPVCPYIHPYISNFLRSDLQNKVIEQVQRDKYVDTDKYTCNKCLENVKNNIILH